MNKLQIIGLALIILIVLIMLTDSTGNDAQAQVKTTWEQPQVCTINTSDWPCLEEKGC